MISTRDATTHAVTALDVLGVAALMLNHLAAPAGTEWKTFIYPLSHTAREDGKLALITLWHAQKNPAEPVQVDEYPAPVLSAVAAVLDRLNETCREAGTRWYSDPLSSRDYESPEVIAGARFWLLTDECARATEMGQVQR